MAESDVADTALELTLAEIKWDKSIHRQPIDAVKVMHLSAE